MRFKPQPHLQHWRLLSRNQLHHAGNAAFNHDQPQQEEVQV